MEFKVIDDKMVCNNMTYKLSSDGEVYILEANFMREEIEKAEQYETIIDNKIKEYLNNEDKAIDELFNGNIEEYIKIMGPDSKEAFSKWLQDHGKTSNLPDEFLNVEATVSFLNLDPEDEYAKSKFRYVVKIMSK